jgi:hypothetical protein
VYFHIILYILPAEAPNLEEYNAWSKRSTSAATHAVQVHKGLVTGAVSPYHTRQRQGNHAKWRRQEASVADKQGKADFRTFRPLRCAGGRTLCVDAEGVLMHAARLGIVGLEKRNP